MPIDRYGVEWDLPPAELCSICGQPDNCGDCTHQPLSAWEIALLKPPFKPPTCILTGAPGEDPDDCTTHEHEK